MPLVTELDLPELDFTDPGLSGTHWHEVMAGLIDSGHWLAGAPLATVVLDREAGEHFLRTKAAIFPGMRIAEIFGIGDGPLFEQMRANIINLGGDDHRRLRGLLNPALSPRAADGYRPAMRGFLEELLADLEPGRAFDFVEAIAKPYPSQTIATVMGAPLADAPRLHDWSMWIQRQFDPIALADPEQVETMQAKAAEFYAWVRPLIELRRQTPGEDLISALIAAERDGDRLSDTELENLVLNVLIGGVDTTQSQLSHAVRLLAERPEQWRELGKDPEGMAAAAVEESLRYEPITPFTARMLSEPVTYREVTFPAETVLMICSYSGNRDPAVFERPDEFDVAKPKPPGRMLTFGAGIHYCVGANLARAELGEALGMLASRWRRLDFEGDPGLQGVGGIYGVDSLPISFA